MTPRRTFSEDHLRRLRHLHAVSDGYGRHRHLYLHDTMRRLATAFAEARGGRPTLLGYGCGKGQFLAEMRRLDLFAEIDGYDPGFAAFQAPPSRRHDVVTCLDVLDAAEPRFLPAVVEDVARLTGYTAIFDCLTKPAAKSGFAPHPAFYWTRIVENAMSVLRIDMHFLGLDGFERAVILAAPQALSPSGPPAP